MQQGNQSVNSLNLDESCIIFSYVRQVCLVFKFPIVGNSNFKLFGIRFPSMHPGLKVRCQLLSQIPFSFWITSSTAQGGGGSFKNRKPIGEVSCCESRMAERIH